VRHESKTVGRTQQGQCRLSGTAARQQFIGEPAELLPEPRKRGGLCRSRRAGGDKRFVESIARHSKKCSRITNTCSNLIS
jgi:hypothetical protein